MTETNPVVANASGIIRGVLEKGIAVFRGIPFARPAGRWASSTSLSPTTTVLEATANGPVSPQVEGYPELFPDGMPPADEFACLNLNVYSPCIDDSRRPVMVWIHGGGYMTGTGSLGLHEGHPLARQGDVVVVTINYRLGALGFLRLVDVTNGDIPSTGNEGLLDMVAALEWVREYIADFGGDPNNVTIFGESAGAWGIASLLATPSARRLFHKAILQSGGGNRLHSVAEANHIAERFVSALGLDGKSAGELLRWPIEKLLKAKQKFLTEDAPRERLGTYVFRPVINGSEVAGPPLDILRAGVGLPVLAGINLDEYNLWAGMEPAMQALDAETVKRRLTRRFGDALAAEFIAVYESSLKGDAVLGKWGAVYSAMLTDQVFRIPVFDLLAANCQGGGSSYAYTFTRPTQLANGSLGAIHAMEICYVFGNLNYPGIEEFSATSQPGATELAAEMMQHWINFASNGKPGHVRNDWEAFEESQRNAMFFGELSGMRCDHWQSKDRVWKKVPDTVMRKL